MNNQEFSRTTTPRDILHVPDRFSSVEVPVDASKYYRDALSHQVVGQDHAVDLVSNIIMRAEAGIGNVDRPKGSMMFLGQTGVGKSELGKAIATTLYGNEWRDHYKRIDCTDFSDNSSVNRLKGATPGYVGYGDSPLLTPNFTNNGAVIMFDEIEKAHPSLFNWLLPVLEEGNVSVFVPTDKVDPTNPHRKTVEEHTLNFSECYLIFTSNIGASELQAERKGTRSMGFGSTTQTSNLENVAIRELKKHFKSKPEFLGRIGERNFVVFNELTQKNYHHIFDKFIEEINKSQRDSVINIQVTPECKNMIVTQAVGNGEYGARDIRDTIEDKLLSDVAKIKYKNMLPSGAIIVADVDDTSGEIIYFKHNAQVAIKQEVQDLTDEDTPPIILPASSDESQIFQS